MEEFRLVYNGTVYWLSREQTILGRSSACTIVVRSRLASREHACIKRVGDQLQIVDLGSKNGTSVNGVRLKGKPRELSVGDQIRIGDATLHVGRPEDAFVADAQATESWLQPPMDDVTTSVDTRSVLDAVEALVTQPPAESSRREALDNARAAVDEMLAGPPLQREEMLRLRQVARNLSELESPRLDAWWRDIERRVAEHVKRA